MTHDEQYLRRAIRLAMNGRGLVEPNPMVGCVIVKHNHIIGEGFHTQFGHPHAEPNALANCTESPEAATAYVTLEPCCHTNKKTPPCVPRLISAKIARVVVGCLDPNPDVNGNGVRQLREAGIVVDGPMLEAECKQLIAPFIQSTVHQRPSITLKWAQSADGKIAGGGGVRTQISNGASTAALQMLRSRCDAIAVGINTVLKDDPILLPRNVTILRPLRRMVLDTHLRTPLDCNLVRTANQGAVEIYTTPAARCIRAEHYNALIDAGVHVIADIDDDATNRLSLSEWLQMLGNDISHLMIEPGPTLARSMLPMCHRLWVIRSPKIIGDDTAPSAPTIPDYFIPTGEVNLDGDRICEYLNTKSLAYFAPVESADLVLSR